MVVTTRTARPIAPAGGSSTVPRWLAVTSATGALFSSAVGSRSSATAATLYSALILAPGFISASRLTWSPTSYSPTLPCGPFSVMRRLSASTASTENTTWMADASPRATGADSAVLALSAGAAVDGTFSVEDVFSLEVFEQDANAKPRRATDNTRYRGFMTGSFPDGRTG